MKKPKPFFADFLLLSSLVFTRCSSDKTDLVSSTGEVLIKNIWTVDYYYNNQDMTGEFSTSRLLFSSTGAVGYQKNGETISGTWSEKIDAAKNQWIILQFNTTNSHISRLNESWKLMRRSANTLQFEGDTPDDILFRIKTQ
jgi:hypothetical protein